MCHSFPNVNLTRSYTILIRSYTINKFFQAEFFLSFKILSGLIKNFYPVSPDRNVLQSLSQATHNLISTYETILSEICKILNTKKSQMSGVQTICDVRAGGGWVIWWMTS